MRIEEKGREGEGRVGRGRDGAQVTRSGKIQHLTRSGKEFSPKTEEYGRRRNPGEVLYRMSSAENGSRGRA